jgi:hypothetical protein
VNPPRRLRDEGDAFERGLLRSARADRMSGEAKRELVTAVASATTLASASRPPGIDIARVGGAGSSMGVTSKWVLWALFGGAAIAASALVITRHGRGGAAAVPMPSVAPDETSTPAFPESHEAPSATLSMPSATTSEQRGTSASEPARGSALARGLAGATSSIGTATATATATAVPDASGTTTSLAAELGLVERARASLRAGRPLDALRALDEHRSRFAHGALEEETTVLRIEAYRLAGDTATTRTLAHEFLATHPRDPYTPRVQRVVSALSPQGAR